MATERENRRPATYSDAADVLESLGNAVTVMRRARRLSLRQMAEQTGVPFNSLRRLENGQTCSTANAVRLLRWFDEPASALIPECTCIDVSGPFGEPRSVLVPGERPCLEHATSGVIRPGEDIDKTGGVGR